MTITQQRITCLACGAVSDLELVANAPIKVVVASMRSARCPKCNSKRLVMGGEHTDKPDTSAPIEERIDWWYKRGDIGISSLTIANVFTGRHLFADGVPHDAIDFKRCKVLLELIPEWRSRLGEVTAKYPFYQPFIEAWDELEQLYDSGDNGLVELLSYLEDHCISAWQRGYESRTGELSYARRKGTRK